MTPSPEPHDSIKTVADMGSKLFAGANLNPAYSRYAEIDTISLLEE